MHNVKATSCGMNWMNDTVQMARIEADHTVQVSDDFGNDYGTVTLTIGAGNRYDYRLNGERISYDNLWKWFGAVGDKVWAATPKRYS